MGKWSTARRSDHKIVSLLLPCCSSQERIRFDVSLNTETWAVSAIPKCTNLQKEQIDTWRKVYTGLVSLLHSDGVSLVKSEGLKWVTFDYEECRLIGFTYTSSWLVLSEAKEVSHLMFCNRHHPTCMARNGSIKASIMHFVLY